MAVHMSPPGKKKDPVIQAKESKPAFIQKVLKGDTYLVLAASAYYPEDEFVGLYYSTQDTSKIFLEPPYQPKMLMYLTTQNNILGQCVEAMEVNIDGTGYELVPIETDEAVLKAKKGEPKLGPDGKPISPFAEAHGADAGVHDELAKLDAEGNPIKPNPFQKKKLGPDGEPLDPEQQMEGQDPEQQKLKEQDPNAEQDPNQDPEQQKQMAEQNPEQQDELSPRPEGEEQPPTDPVQLEEWKKRRAQSVQKADFPPKKKKPGEEEPQQQAQPKPGQQPGQQEYVQNAPPGQPRTLQDGVQPPEPGTANARRMNNGVNEHAKGEQPANADQKVALPAQGPNKSEPYDKEGKPTNQATPEGHEQTSSPQAQAAAGNDPTGNRLPQDKSSPPFGGKPSQNDGQSSFGGPDSQKPGMPGGPGQPPGQMAPGMPGADGEEPEDPAITQKHKEEDEERKRLEAFLDEPFPNSSFVTIRRNLRRDLESCGYGAIEVLRNPTNEVVGLRNVMATALRLVRLDAPVLVKKMVKRQGKDVELQFWDRERRYAIKTGNNQYTFYRDFGTTRQINRETGNWETKDSPVAPELRGTELLYFRVINDVQTPYGIPRWINQMPSVLGSRKAEEQNLEFFDAGGLPPAIIFVDGGTLAADMADQLRMYLSGQMKAKNRAVVVETQSSSGSIDAAGTVKTRVERFGAEATKDAMYVTYDKNTEEHVRVGFRLPPLFIGRSNDYNYASAQVSYMVAEAQVFEPERQEFDEVINRTIMKELGAKRLKFKSKPITLKDLETQIKALQFAQPVAEGESYMENLNKVTGLTLKYEKQQQAGPGGQDPLGGATHMDQDGNLIKPNVDPMTGEPVSLPKGAIEIPGAAPQPFGGKPNPFQKGGKPNPFDKGAKPNPFDKGAKPNPFQKGGNQMPPQFQKKKPALSVVKGASEVLQLAKDFCQTEGLVPGRFEHTSHDRERVRKAVDELSPDDRELLNRFVGIQMQAALDTGAL